MTTSDPDNRVKNIRTFVVDDSPVVLAAICSFLESGSEIEVVGTAENGQQALKQLSRLHPDLVLIDLELPDMNGVELLAQLRRMTPATRIIVLTVHDEPEIVRRCYASGAHGFVSKSHMGERLVFEIRKLFLKLPPSM